MHLLQTARGVLGMLQHVRVLVGRPAKPSIAGMHVQVLTRRGPGRWSERRRL